MNHAGQHWPVRLMCFGALRRLHLIPTLLFLFALSGASNPDDPKPELRTTLFGPVFGTHDGETDTYAWKGIPYARPPVGNLRWRPPVDPDLWHKPLEATKFGNACVQIGSLYGPGLNNRYDATIGTTINKPVGSEDCLTLNIWRPATKESKLPVVVFFHGGGDYDDFAGDPIYDGAHLAHMINAVVVSFDYRLNGLGFFNLAQLKTGDPVADSGNFGLLDAIQVLKFVRHNVGVFGGDPSNVTLSGQSAGALDIWALLASPQAAGLFHKAAAFSCGISLASKFPTGSIPFLNPAAFYATQSKSILYHSLIAAGRAHDMTGAASVAARMSNRDVATFMRGIPAAELATTTFSVNKGDLGGPIPDGTVVPADVVAAIAAGKYNRMPILASNTNEESKIFPALLSLLGGPPGFVVDDAKLFTIMANYASDKPTLTDANLVNPAYLPITKPTTGYNAVNAKLTRSFFYARRDNLLNTLVKHQLNVWYYEFDWAQEPTPWNDLYGAAHLIDMMFMLRNFGSSVISRAVSSTANQPGRLALSDAMMASLGAFVRTGNPNNPKLPVAWKPWPAKVVFDATLMRAKISAQ